MGKDIQVVAVGDIVRGPEHARFSPNLNHFSRREHGALFPRFRYGVKLHLADRLPVGQALLNLLSIPLRNNTADLPQRAAK